MLVVIDEYHLFQSTPRYVAHLYANNVVLRAWNLFSRRLLEGKVHLFTSSALQPPHPCGYKIQVLMSSDCSYTLYN